MDKRIVVLQRGWVVVGDYTISGEEVVVVVGDYTISGEEVVIENGSVVRRWGTTEGLGEIAMKGPTKDTVLDPIPELRVHRLGVVFTLQCMAKKWRKQ